MASPDTGNSTVADEIASPDSEKPTSADDTTPSVTVKPTSSEQSVPSVTEKPTSSEQSAPSVTEKPTSSEQSAPSDTVKPSLTEQSAPSVTEKPTSSEQSAPSDTVKPTSSEQSAPSDTVKPTSSEQSAPSDTVKPTTSEQSAPSDTVKLTTSEQPAPSDTVKLSLTERYVASMVLSGVGDALGYKNGEWEFCHSGRVIHQQLEQLGGLSKIKINKWNVSDDTVLHLATGEALVKAEGCDVEGMYRELAVQYIEGMKDMGGRSPGPTTMNAVRVLRPDQPLGYTTPFNERGGGCGAAMRSMCIGLRYPRPADMDHLIAVSVESGRMTHHHPTGYLGSLAGALFTAYAIQGKPVREWGHGLMGTLDQAKTYVQSQNRFVQENLTNWDYFTTRWSDYLSERGLTSGETDPTFPAEFDIEQRDKFYKMLSFSGWGGASGHDAPMIAYDALLGSGDSWSEVCSRGMFHSGDSDSTAVMVAAWYGAIYGFNGVPKNLYKNLEYRDRLARCGLQLLKLSHPGEEVDKMYRSFDKDGLPDVPGDKKTMIRDECLLM